MSTTPAPDAINPDDAAALGAALDAARKVDFALGRTIIADFLAAEVDGGRVDTSFLRHCLARHAQGDWGDVSEHDREANERALIDGTRIWSRYNTAEVEDGKIWIITDAADDGGHRHQTTIMLPSDY